MSKIFPIQNDFSSGQLSEKMFARVNNEKYLRGLSECTNFLPLPQGILERRKGTKHMYQFDPGILNGRIVPFHMSDDLAFDVVLTDDGEIRFFTKSGPYANPGTPDDFIMDAPDFNMTAFNMKIPVWNGSEYIPTASPQVDGEWAIKMSAWSHVEHHNEEGYSTMEFAPTAGRLNDDIDISFNINSSYAWVTDRELRIGSTLHGSELGTISLPETGLVGFTFNPNGNALIHFSFHGISPLPFVAQATANIDSFEIVQRSVAASLSINHHYNNAALDEFHFEMHPSPDEEELWLTHRDHQPYILRYTLATGTFTLTGAITSNVIVTPPLDWSTPPTLGDPPPVDANFPGGLSFHQGRLWFGGTNEQPNALYASAADGTYVEFATPDTTTAATPINIYIARKCDIKWLASSDGLLVGTDVGIFIPESSTGLLATTDISANLKSGYSTSNSVPIFVSNRPVYSADGGRKLRDLIYTEEGQEFTTKDLTFEHDDITDNSPIGNMDYNQESENMIQCESSGASLICLYNKHLDLVGWSVRNQVSDIKSISSLKDSAGNHTSYLMLSTQNRLSLVWDDPVNFLDDNIEIINGPPSTAVSAPHLADQTVSVLADGELLADVVLDSSGNGVIAQEASNVLLGYPYSSRLKTLPKNIMISVIQHGFTSLKNWSKIYVSLLKSTNPLINGKRTPDILAGGPTGAPVASTKRIMQLDSGWDDEGIIEIEQDQPFPCTIAAIYGEMSEEL